MTPHSVLSRQTRGGGLGVLPLKKIGLNGVKLCNFRQNKHGNGTFMKARDSVYDGRRGVTLWTWKWFGFFKYLHYVWYWRAKRARKKIKKQPLDPLFYPSHLHTRPPPLTNLRGVRTPVPPPLWIRAWLLEYDAKIEIDHRMNNHI